MDLPQPIQSLRPDVLEIGSISVLFEDGQEPFVQVTVFYQVVRFPGCFYRGVYFQFYVGRSIFQLLQAFKEILLCVLDDNTSPLVGRFDGNGAVLSEIRQCLLVFK